MSSGKEFDAFSHRVCAFFEKDKKVFEILQKKC